MTEYTHWSEKLVALNACGDSIVWAKTKPNEPTAWRECQRGDWMLWIIGDVAGEPWSDERKPMVMAACECARLSLHLAPAGDERPRIAIETSEAWCRREATPERVRAAYAAAYAATAAAYAAAYAATAAAAAAAYAAAVYAAAYVAAAYAAAADAAMAADAAAARGAILVKCADIVRKHYPKPPRLR